MPSRQRTQPSNPRLITVLLLVSANLLPTIVATDSHSEVTILNSHQLSDHLSRHRQTVLLAIHEGRNDYMQAAGALIQAQRRFALSNPELSFAIYRIGEKSGQRELYAVDWYKMGIFFVDHAVRKPYPGRLDSEAAIAEWVRVMAGFEPSLIVASLSELQELCQSHRLVGLYTGDQGSKFLSYAVAARGIESIVFRHSFDSELSSVIGQGISLFKHFDDGRDTFTGEYTVDNLRAFFLASSKQLVRDHQPKDHSGDSHPAAVAEDSLIIFSDSFLDPENRLFFQTARVLGSRFQYFHSTKEDPSFNVDLKQGPQLVLVPKMAESQPTVLPKYKLLGPLTLEKIVQFIKDYDNKTLEPFASSQPLSERGVSESGVKTVVGLSIKEDIHDFEGAVFLMIYAPWGGHCKHFLPTLEAAAAELQGYEHPVLLAKVQGTTNELEGFEMRGYPTLLFRRQRNGSWENYIGDRSSEAVVNYIRTALVSPNSVEEDL